MIPDKILYTDGHDVTVTDSTFQVKNTSYNLRGIVRHGLLIMKPHRLPGVIMLALGLVLVCCGLLALFPADALRSIDADMNANDFALWTGVGLSVVGLLVIALMRERYAVRIATAEGEKNAVVSYRKEYIAQIVSALNAALRLEHPGPSRSFVVVKE